MSNIVREIFTAAVFHEAGILPIRSSRHKHAKELEAMSPADARRAKRKFRKLWRKVAKAKVREAPTEWSRQLTISRTGLGVKTPTRSHIRERKMSVMGHVAAAVTKLIHGSETANGSGSNTTGLGNSRDS